MQTAPADTNDISLSLRERLCHYVSGGGEPEEKVSEDRITERKPTSIIARRRRVNEPRLWPLMADMPALPHWPDRSKPFDYADSRVVAYARDRFGIQMDLAIRVFHFAASKKVIVFDRATGLWCGTKGGAA